MKQDDARRIVVTEFDVWVKREGFKGKPTTTDAFGFFGYLTSANHPALQFRYTGDKWPKVKRWLYQEVRIKDALRI